MLVLVGVCGFPFWCVVFASVCGLGSSYCRWVLGLGLVCCLGLVGLVGFAGFVLGWVVTWWFAGLGRWGGCDTCFLAGGF